MQKDANRLWSTRIVTFAISALAAASVVFWGFKGWETYTPSTGATIALIQAPPVSSQDVAKALGGGGVSNPTASAVPPVINRYKLVGVVAGRFRGGAALISVDGQDAKPVRAGTLVEEGMLLQSVSGRSAILVSTTDASAKVTLELPLLTE